MKTASPAIASLLTLALAACATTSKPPPAVFIEADRRPERRSLPPNPREEKLEGQFSKDEWVEPALQGGVLAKSGLLVSESRMARDILFRTRYDELRKVYEADRLVWSAHRDYYEERLNLAGEEIQKLQPTWWDRHKDTVGFIAGTLVGFGITLGIVEIVYRTK